MTKWQLHIGRLGADGMVTGARFFAPDEPGRPAADEALNVLLDEGWEPAGFAVGRSSVIMLRKPWKPSPSDGGVGDAWRF